LGRLCSAGEFVQDSENVSESREWEELRKELEALADVAHAFNAYVLDAWDNVWCAARWFTSIYPEDLIAFVHAAIARKGIPLQRGGKLDVPLVPVEMRRWAVRKTS
jgi:hypothetical protein